jgi:hypothetical protein
MLMRPDGMGWSWEDLQNTPPYVKRYCIDFLNIQRRVEAGAIEKARRKQQQQG